jgi:hypothetical protein
MRGEHEAAALAQRPAASARATHNHAFGELRPADLGSRRGEVIACRLGRERDRAGQAGYRQDRKNRGQAGHGAASI